MIPFAHVSSLITDASNNNDSDRNDWTIGGVTVQRWAKNCEMTVSYPDLSRVSSCDIDQFAVAAAARGYKLCYWSFNASEKVMTFIFEQEA